jgi:predicted RNA-binding protein YlqC (UPF0109 family)
MKKKPKKAKVAPLSNGAKEITGIITGLLKGLTSHHAELEIKPMRSGSILGIEYTVHADDMPKAVGFYGRHHAALVEIANALGNRHGIKVVLSLLEPIKGEKMPPRGFIANKNWQEEPTRELLKETLTALLTQPFEIKPTAGEINTFFHITTKDLGFEKLRNSLYILFDAIGKAQGRLIYITGDKEPEAA